MYKAPNIKKKKNNNQKKKIVVVVRFFETLILIIKNFKLLNHSLISNIYLLEIIK